MQGILLVDKPKGKTSFSLVAVLRRLTGERRIGHAGTLDPLATGVMVMLIGRQWTKRSNEFLGEDKEYLADVTLGESTTTYDAEGDVVETSDKVPTLEEIQSVLQSFTGTIQQVPPMFSAKKIKGQKLYHLARRGQSVERPPATVNVAIELIEFSYPKLTLQVACSKGTYIRSLAQDIGEALGCYGYLSDLRRIRSGGFCIDQCIDGKQLFESTPDINPHLLSPSA